MTIPDKILIFKGFKINSIITAVYYSYTTLKIYGCFK
nr:MAG TPA: hypothetical protein [Caudoviricetes sp.]